MTYSKQNPQKSSASQEADDPIFLPYSPKDMGDENGLELARYRDQLCSLHNKMANLPMTDKSEEFGKISTAMNIARKGYYENISHRDETIKQQAALNEAKEKARTPISDAEFDEDLKALGDLLNALPAAAFKSSGGPKPDVSTAAIMAAQAAQRVSSKKDNN